MMDFKVANNPSSLDDIKNLVNAKDNSPTKKLTQKIDEIKVKRPSFVNERKP
jgi:hypothetical protein